MTELTLMASYFSSFCGHLFGKFLLSGILHHRVHVEFVISLHPNGKAQSIISAVGLTVVMQGPLQLFCLG